QRLVEFGRIPAENRVDAHGLVRRHVRVNTRLTIGGVQQRRVLGIQAHAFDYPRLPVHEQREATMSAAHFYVTGSSRGQRCGLIEPSITCEGARGCRAYE